MKPPLANQRQLNFDPDIAAEATAQRQIDDAANKKALADESALADKAMKDKEASTEANEAKNKDAWKQKQYQESAGAKVVQAQTDMIAAHSDIDTITHAVVGSNKVYFNASLGCYQGDPVIAKEANDDLAGISTDQQIIQAGGK